MIRKKSQPDAVAISAGKVLRQRAEAQVLREVPPPQAFAAMTPEAMQQTLYELQVHQIELEMQNEELRRTYEEAAISLARYQDLYDMAPVGYVTVSESGLILEANLTASVLLGVPRGRLINQLLSGFVTKDHQSIYYLCSKQLVPHAEPQAFELRMQKHDGVLFWARVEMSVTKNASGEPVRRVVLIDITQKKQIEESLWIKNRAFDVSITANSVANCDGVITELNDAFLQIWGYHEKSEVIGKPIMHLFEHQKQAVAILRALMGAGFWEGDYDAKRKDGSTFVAHGLASILRDDSGHVIGYQSAVMDVTVQRQNEQTLLEWSHALERRIAERTCELQKMLVQFQVQQRELAHAQKLALISEVSAGIIHQISQPLCAMSLNLSVLVDRIHACATQDCGTMEIAQDLDAAVNRMRDVIIHMQTICHSGPRSYAPMDLKQMTESIMCLLKEEAIQREIDLSLGFGQDLPLVSADSVQLCQVILNLVHNAFDACSDCPPERRKVVITTRAIEGDHIELSVCDTGAGIAPEALANLFIAFFTTKENGLGIGLRLSRTIAEAHGGHIKASNNSDGIGATFRLILPSLPKA